MTKNQIIAVNNAMNMLTELEGLAQMNGVAYYTEYTDRYVRALELYEVDRDIIDHFKMLIAAYRHVAEETEKKYKEWEELCRIQNSWLPTSPDDLMLD